MDVACFEKGAGGHAHKWIRHVRECIELQLLDLGNPGLDFVKIAEGMGVPGRRVTTAEEFASALAVAFDEPGPHLIEAVVPSVVSDLFKTG